MKGVLHFVKAWIDTTSPLGLPQFSRVLKSFPERNGTCAMASRGALSMNSGRLNIQRRR